MTIANIDINGHTYTDAMWRADWEGTISAIANDIAAAVAGAALVGGTLHKTLSGDYSLTPSECENRVYVYTGSLGAAAAVYFDSSFQGLALIKNNTNQPIHQRQAGGGGEVVIASGWTAFVYSDGSGVHNATGTASNGSDVAIVGNETVGGTLGVTGTATVTGNLEVAGIFNGHQINGTVATISGNLGVGVNLSVGGDIDADGHIAGQDVFVNGVLYCWNDAWFWHGTLHLNEDSDEARFQLSTPNAFSQWIELETNGVARWLFGKNNTPETGADRGSDFDIGAQPDSGEVSGGGSGHTWLRIYRKNGHVQLNGMPTGAPSGEGSLVLYMDENRFVKCT